jgi:hypothetical protein
LWRNNNLSIVLFLLFVSLAGHAASGWRADAEKRRQHGDQEISFGAVVRSAEFGESVFENWESEFLQMEFYVLLTVFLYQRGSSESKKHRGRWDRARACVSRETCQPGRTRSSSSVPRTAAGVTRCRYRIRVLGG